MLKIENSVSEQKSIEKTKMKALKRPIHRGLKIEFSKKAKRQQKMIKIAETILNKLTSPYQPPQY